MIELAGFQDAQSFVNTEVPPMPPQPQEPPKPDAAEMLAQAEAMKAQVSAQKAMIDACLLYTSPSPRDRTRSRMPSSA